LLVLSVYLLAFTFSQKINVGGNMDIISLLIFLAVGALVGWLAGNIVKGRGFGVIGNIIVGVVGAVLGGYVFGMLGITTGGFLGSVIMAVIGAVILLYIISIIKKV
jgi:uncharacterized membrane protein YeaQ/YmgE (transglycosylase-associated protein family)